MRLTRLLALSLLAVLVVAACGPVSPAPGMTQDLSTATDVPQPVLPPSSSSTPPPIFTATPTLPPTPFPLPKVEVDPALLHDLNLQVWHAFTGPAYDLFTRQVAQF